MQVVYSLLKSEEIVPLLAAYAKWLPDGVRVGEMFAWRRAGEPASGGICPAIAKLDGHIIGAVSAVSAQAVLRGLPVRAVWQQDSVVAPQARGKGVGKLLVAEAAKGAELVLAKSTTPPMYALRKSVRFEDVPDRTFRVRVLSPRVAGGVLKRLAYGGLWLRNHLLRVDNAPTSLVVQRTKHFDTAFDQLASRVVALDEIGLVKTSAYLNWRYVGVPGRSYVLLRADDAMRLRGAAVLRLPASAGGRGWLVDLVCPSEDREAVDALVSAAVRELAAAGAADVKTFASSSRICAHLSRRGFFTTSETPQFTYRAETEEVRRALEGIIWNFWWGDGDSELLEEVSSFTRTLAR